MNGNGSHNGRRLRILENPAPIHNSLFATPDERRAELLLPKDMQFFASALGGRFRAGALVLCGGSPGSGKSILTTQIALRLATMGAKSLFLLNEQSATAMKERADRMTSDMSRAEAERAMAGIAVEAPLYDVSALPALAMRDVLNPAGRYHGVQLVVLDSIQGEGLPSAATKEYAKVLEFGRLLAGNGISTILISHVTKRGELAGPKMLEHGVDVTLVLRRAMLYSLLGVRKNRFGPPLLRPLPLMIDPVTTRMAVAPHAQARPGAAMTYGGPMSGPMQIQASVAVPADGRRGRTTAPGLPRKEIEQLIDCIGQIDGLDLSELDYRIQCRLPRNGQYLTYFGLPLCMALIASYTRKPLPESNMYLGEIDLFRNVLDVPPVVLQNLRAAIDNGEIPTPVTLYVPPSAVAPLPQSTGRVRVEACPTLEAAILKTWPDLRVN
ncbi:MAG: DNA repair protein RadA [Planctomycetes bacterium]|nr:DNA repair protein RadA [Planctomycetota bacterium]